MALAGLGIAFVAFLDTPSYCAHWIGNRCFAYRPDLTATLVYSLGISALAFAVYALGTARTIKRVPPQDASARRTPNQ
jgi:hypothetical protein